MHITFRCDPALEPHLPRPVAARRALPDWLKSMPATAHSPMHDSDVRTVKQCPPFIDAMSAGFLMLLPCDVIYANGAFAWDWGLPAPSLPGQAVAPVNFHAAAQAAGTPLSDGSANFIKFTSFWTIELPPGWSLLATHPFNREDLPFRTLTGLVDADTFHHVGILFPARWLDPSRDRVLRAGTPVAQCLPVQREELNMEFGVIDGERAADFTTTGGRILAGPGVYRRDYRHKS